MGSEFLLPGPKIPLAWLRYSLDVLEYLELVYEHTFSKTDCFALV